METIQTNTVAGGYRLKSELARVCLPAPHAHEQRNLAWTNSICLMFLVIGLVGFRPAPPQPIVVKPLEEAQPVIIEAPPPPPATVELKPEDNPPVEPEAAPPRMVVVTRESPAIRFSVPTVGNLVVPNALAVAPPAAPAQLAAPPRAAPPQPSPLNNTGTGGDRPKPDYPNMALELGQQGSVVLLLTADEAGVIIAVEVKTSSGSSILDRAAADFVKKHWTVSQGGRGRLFQARIDYKLTQR
jgi:protein TonB